MAGENAVIIKRIKKGGHGGHHGGAWKVAYADFVTAMMAFFLLMWLINTTTPEQKRGIADYFAPQSIAADRERRRRRARRQGDGRGQRARRRRAVGVPEEQSRPRPPTRRTPAERQRAWRRATPGPGAAPQSRAAQCRHASSQDGDFAHAAEAIHQAMQDNPDIANLSHQVMMDNTPEGLRIQLVDQDGRPMFQHGTAEPMPYTKRLLAEIGKIIDRLPNRVSISGHTEGDAVRRRERHDQLGTFRRARQCGARAAGGWRAGLRTASTKWRARPAPSRCCRKTRTPRPTAGSASCCCAKRRRSRPGINSNRQIVSPHWRDGTDPLS